MAQTKLKPCPFCGSDVVLRKEDVIIAPERWKNQITPQPSYSFDCDQCSCELKHFWSVQEAIKAWNRRDTGTD